MISIVQRGNHRWALTVTIAALTALIITIGLVVYATPTQAQEAQWMRQFGSAGHDAATSAAADASGVVVAGWTGDALPGQTFAGGPDDAFVVKYDRSGAVAWTSQFGTPGSDVATAVAIAPDGPVYVTGQAGGRLAEGATGPFDAFVRKHNADGTVAWTRQFGAGATNASAATSVAVDKTGALYVAGWVRGALPGATGAGQDDGFVRRYDAAGTELWTRQFGGSGSDLATTVAVDAAGDVYVAGKIDQRPDNVGSTVLRKYRPSGEEQGSRPIGGANDYTRAVTVDATGAVYQVGDTPPAGKAQSPHEGHHGGVAFVRKYAPDGGTAWTRQFGARGAEPAAKLAVDSTGTVHVAGHTSAGPERAARTVRATAFLRTFGADGTPGANRPFAGARYATGTAVAVGPPGDTYLVGWTGGALPRQTASGASDAFVSKV